MAIINGKHYDRMYINHISAFLRDQVKYFLIFVNIAINLLVLILSRSVLKKFFQMKRRSGKVYRDILYLVYKKSLLDWLS